MYLQHCGNETYATSQDDAASKEPDHGYEAKTLQKAWSEILPTSSMKSSSANVLAGSGQFALSRHRIKALPLKQYVWFRTWLLKTKLKDWEIARVWQYLWVYVFTGELETSTPSSMCEGTLPQ
jgi:hypothetical protein